MNILCTSNLGEDSFEKLKKICGNNKLIVSKPSIEIKDLDKVEIWLAYTKQITMEMLSKMPSLKWIHIAQAGVDSIPIEYLIEKNIIVTNSKGMNSITISEYVMAMILNIEGSIFKYYNAFLKKDWDLTTRKGEAYGKTIGIIGMGKVGCEIAKKAKAMGLRVIGLDLFEIHNDDCDLKLGTKEINRLLDEADYVVLSIPLTDETHYIIDEPSFDVMKDSSILINVGRGGLVNEKALVKALKDKKIRFAVLDVLETEPLPSNSELWDLDNIVITPHIAGARFEEYKTRVVDIFETNFNNYNNGKMINVIDLKRGF